MLLLRANAHMLTCPAAILAQVRPAQTHGGQEESTEPTQEVTQETQGNATNDNGAQDGSCIPTYKAMKVRVGPHPSTLPTTIVSIFAQNSPLLQLYSYIS